MADTGFPVSSPQTLAVDEKLELSIQKNVSSLVGTVAPKTPGSAWQKFLSESTANSIDQFEEGALGETGNEGALGETGNEVENSHRKPAANTQTDRPLWREFASDPGINLSDVNVTFPRRYSYDDFQTKGRHDWGQFMSTSQLFDGEQKSQISTLVQTNEGATGQGTSAVEDEDLKISEWRTLDVISNTPKKTDSYGSLDDKALPEPSQATSSAMNIASERQASTNLPIRPLTIGDNETMGTTLVYRPLSPFDHDLYPSRTSSSTPVVPTLPPASVHTRSVHDEDMDEKDGDMSARERLQPLGRDGLEVKQGPPWGMTIPMFQPHSRNSSMSSNDSNSSSINTNFVRLQTMTPKSDTDSPVVSVAISNSQLSQKSSLRSLESKEPLSAAKVTSDDTRSPKTQIGRFHNLHATTKDTESPVSKILGPTFKTTQKILQDLQRNPLGFHQDEQPPLKEDSLKMPPGIESDHAQSSIAEGSLDYGGALPQNDISVAKISQDESVPTSTPSWRSSGNSTAKQDFDSFVEINRSADHSARPSESRFSRDAQIFDGSGQYNKKEDSLITQGTTLPIKAASSENDVSGKSANSENVTKNQLKQNIDGVTQESLSWDNILEVGAASGAVNEDISEFDRVASQSISLSNAVANSFREELNRTFDLLEVESDEEGTLTDHEPEAAQDSGLSETTTTNEDMFLPKGLEPLTSQHGPVGVYDIRTSCGPGSTNRKRYALGRSGHKIAPPVAVSGVYVSDGTTGPSSTEVEDKDIQSQPDGQSTPKSDEGSLMKSRNGEYTRDPSLPSKDGSMAGVVPSTVVDYIWSVKTPVMSQLKSKPKPLIVSEVKQKKNYFSKEPVSGQEKKRVSRQKEANKKKGRNHVSAQTSENTSSDSSYQGKSGARRAKKNVADIILDNFRREEQEQKKRQQKMEELRQAQSTTDLNELWERFQYILGKNSHKPKKHSMTLSTPRTTPSELSTLSDPDKSSSESTLLQGRTPSSVTTDTDEEFEKFIRRVCAVQNTSSESTASHRSGHERQRKYYDHAPNGDVRHRMSHRRINDMSDKATTTTEQGSEVETPLSIPMWLGMRHKYSKKKPENSCTCGGRSEKSTSRAPCVRDVGVNCPTPPLGISFPRPPVVLNPSRPPLVNHDMNIVNLSRAPTENNVNFVMQQAPSSLVKLSLQDAFMYSNEDFIKRSQERVSRIKAKRKEKGLAAPVVVPTGKTKKFINEKAEEELKTTVDKPLKLYDQLLQKKPRPMSQKEIRNVNKRIYNKLPEVRKRKDEERKASRYKTNRLRVQLYGKHVRNLNRMCTAP